MYLSYALASLLAVGVAAAPAYPDLNLQDELYPADALDAVSSYFNLLASKVHAAKTSSESPICDVSRAQMPTAPDPMAPPTPGLTVRHVAVGRGTQNYTCDAGNSTAIPQAAGALATLFNATCVAALYPDLLEKMPGMAVHFDLSNTDLLGPALLPVSGVHYFRNATTPFFDLDTAHGDLGVAPCAKNSSTSAPSTAAVGQNGEAAVAWLRLQTIDGATGNMKEVYRVTTAGGSPPATCENMPATFEVQYSALYWFWEGNPKDE